MKPSIGFDRDIKLEWLDAVATQVSAGRNTREVRASIHAMLAGKLASGKSGAALTKTTTVLLRIWSQVPDTAVPLRDRLAPVIPDLGPQDRLAAHWAMCCATHPFFLDVATHTGRLLTLQGDVSLPSLRRRLAERWGDRSLMPQATRKVVRSMVAWRALQSARPGLYTHAIAPIPSSPQAGIFLLEAILIGSGKRSLPATDLERHPALFPFRITTSLSALRAVRHLSVHRQGVDTEVVELVGG